MTGPHTHCRRGLHRFTPANTVYVQQPDGRAYRLCRECRDAQKTEWNKIGRNRLPNESGWCQKGLHRWVPGSNTRCKPCRQAYDRQLMKRPHVYCIVGKCERYTVKLGVDTYICGEHRSRPPAWIARAGLRIVGTEVLAA